MSLPSSRSLGCYPIADRNSNISLKESKQSPNGGESFFQRFVMRARRKSHSPTPSAAALSPQQRPGLLATIFGNPHLKLRRKSGEEGGKKYHTPLLDRHVEESASASRSGVATPPQSPVTNQLPPIVKLSKANQMHVGLTQFETCDEFMLTDEDIMNENDIEMPVTSLAAHNGDKRGRLFSLPEHTFVLKTEVRVLMGPAKTETNVFQTRANTCPVLFSSGIVAVEVAQNVGRDQVETDTDKHMAVANVENVVSQSTGPPKAVRTHVLQEKHEPLVYAEKVVSKIVEIRKAPPPEPLAPVNIEPLIPRVDIIQATPEPVTPKMDDHMTYPEPVTPTMQFSIENFEPMETADRESKVDGTVSNCKMETQRDNLLEQVMEMAHAVMADAKKVTEHISTVRSGTEKAKSTESLPEPVITEPAFPPQTTESATKEHPRRSSLERSPRGSLTVDTELNPIPELQLLPDHHELKILHDHEQNLEMIPEDAPDMFDLFESDEIDYVDPSMIHNIPLPSKISMGGIPGQKEVPQISQDKKAAPRKAPPKIQPQKSDAQKSPRQKAPQKPTALAEKSSQKAPVGKGPPQKAAHQTSVQKAPPQKTSTEHSTSQKSPSLPPKSPIPTTKTKPTATVTPTQKGASTSKPIPTPKVPMQTAPKKPSLPDQSTSAILKKPPPLSPRTQPTKKPTAPTSSATTAQKKLPQSSSSGTEKTAKSQSPSAPPAKKTISAVASAKKTGPGVKK